MQNQDHFNTQDQNKKLSRQEYQRRYYQQNKARLTLKRKGLVNTNVLPLFGSESLTTASGSGGGRRIFTIFLRILELVALLALTVTMTYLLVKESAGFYLDAKESTSSAYLKAGMLELAAVLFSFSRSRHSLLQWGQRFVLVLLCGLSLFTMSQRVIQNASQDKTRVQSAMRIIHELEAERTQKEALREQYLSRGWLRMTRKYEKGLEQIREKLISAHQEMSTMQTPRVIVGSLVVLILFRLALLVGNLVCVHRIVEQFHFEIVPDTKG